MILDKYRDFLFIHYKYKDIIIDRKQFSRSVSFNSINSVNLGFKNLNTVIEYGTESILNFDLDAYLVETFKVEIDSDTKLCVIANIEDFSEETRVLLTDIFKKCDKNVSDDAISFSISSKSEIKRYGIDQFKDLSKVYKEQFKNKGILSCFFREERIQYFINIDKFLYMSITDAGE